MHNFPKSLQSRLARALVLVSVSLLQSIAIADAPDLKILSGITIDNFLELDNWDTQPVLLLMDPSSTNDAAWESSVWNDPALIKFIQNQNLQVIWLDPSIDDFYPTSLNPLQLPIARFGLVPGDSDQNRLAIEPGESPETIIKWLSPLLHGSTLITELYQVIVHHPTDVDARLELLNEYQRQHGVNRHLFYDQKLIHDVFIMNEPWSVYMQTNADYTESQFRGVMIEIIEIYRTGYHLFGEPEDDGKPRFIRSGWQGIIEYTEIPYSTFNYGKGVGGKIRALEFRRYFENLRDNCTATDRDLFILKALTAEGEEWQQLKEQYQDPDE